MEGIGKDAAGNIPIARATEVDLANLGHTASILVEFPDTPDPRHWNGIDDSGDPASYGDYLADVTTLSAVMLSKRRSLELLRIRPNDAVLDVGCGRGADLSKLIEATPDGRAIGLDNSLTLLTLASQTAPGAPLTQGSAYRLPFHHDSFDVVRAERVLMHLDEPGRAVTEMVRVLRPAGRILLADPDSDLIALVGADEGLVADVLQYRRTLVRSPNAGRLHSLWLRNAGIYDLELDYSARAVTGVAETERNTQIIKAVAIGEAEGVFPSGTQQRWYDQLRAAEERGEFLAIVVYMRTVGTRLDGGHHVPAGERTS